MFIFKNISEYGVFLKGNKRTVLVEPQAEIKFNTQKELDEFLSDITVFLGKRLQQVLHGKTEDKKVVSKEPVKPIKEETTPVEEVKPVEETAPVEEVKPSKPATSPKHKKGK